MHAPRPKIGRANGDEPFTLILFAGRARRLAPVADLLRSVFKWRAQVWRDGTDPRTVKTTKMIEHNQRAKTIGLISFVVPAWNEEAHLAGTLTCIREAAQSLGERFEIVVANDGSTDRTGQIAEQLADRTVLVRHRQIAAARNAGAQAARGDLLIFVDADTTVTDGLLRTTLQAVCQGAVGGGCLARFDAPVPIWGWLATALANAYCRLFNSSSRKSKLV